MRIGVVIYGSLETVSGGYLYDRRLVASLRSRGEDVRIVSLPWRNYLAHMGDNLTFRLPPGLDLLIQDELNHPSLLAANARPHPCPVISLVHHLRSSESRPGWQNRFFRAIERQYLRSLDGFIFNSRTTEAAVTALAGTGKPSLVAFPPTDRFGPGLTEAQVRLRAEAPGPLRLLFLGNLIARKGLHTLLEALRRLPGGDFRLEVVGRMDVDPGYARRLLAQVKAGGLAERVRFHGPLADDQLAAQLAAAHVLVVPSTYEGYGIVYLEGMGFGLPAVATSAGGASEIVTDGENGCLVPPGEPDALATRLSGLARDRGLLARLSLGALERYRRQPAWEETAAGVHDFLLGFAHVHSSGRPPLE